LINECDQQAEALHLELDRAQMQEVIDRATVTWPRRIFEVPVART